MIFLCFGGKSSVVFSCYLGSLDPIFVVQASFTRSFCVASTDYQRFLASLKLMTSQVVQIARPLTGRICPVRAQRVKMNSSLLRTHCQSAGLRIELSVFESWLSLCCVLGRYPLLSQCLSPPRCIKGYQRPCDGLASDPGRIRNISSRFMLQ